MSETTSTRRRRRPPATARSPTGRPTSTTPTRRTTGTPTRSGPSCASSARSPTRDRYDGAWLPVTHADVSADRPRHRELHVAGRPRQQPARSWPRRRSAAHRRSPATRRSTTTPAGCCCRRSPPRRSSRGRTTSARCATSCSTRSRRAPTAIDRVVDASAMYTQHIPVNVIARMLGFPLEDADLFRGFVHDSSRTSTRRRRSAQPRSSGSTPTSTCRSRTTSTTRATTSPLPDGRRRSSTSRCARPRPRLHRAAAARRHRHDVERDRLVALAPRRASRRPRPPGRRRPSCGRRPSRSCCACTPRSPWPASSPRTTSFNGCPMKEDEWVLLPFPAANLDPEFFDRADEVLLDRADEPSRRVRPRHPPLPRLQPRPAGGDASPCRSSSSGSTTSSSPTPTPSAGATARSAARATSR